SERRRNPALLALREVVGLADVVQHVELHHQMMDVALSGLDHRETVMTRVEMEEVRLERPQREITEVKPKRLRVERQQSTDAVDVQHDVPHAERAGAES